MNRTQLTDALDGAPLYGCIRTGAELFLTWEGKAYRGDLFAYGDCLIFRHNREGSYTYSSINGSVESYYHHWQAEDYPILIFGIQDLVGFTYESREML